MSKFRIAFMGTPDFAVPALQSLIAGPFDLVCVYTQPPRPAGRGQQLQESPVHRAAEEAGIEVRHPKNFKKEGDVEMFEDLNLDLAVVAAYGLILPKSILDAPKHGCVNIHASLLPRWRGAAPIQRCIEAGDEQTGICIMQMEEGLDTGPVMMRQVLPISNFTTGGILHDELSDLAAQMIVPSVQLIQAGAATFEPQPEDGVTYAKKLEKHEGKIDWSKNARDIDLQIRAFTPWPGAWCEIHPNNTRLKVLEAEYIPDLKAPKGVLIDRDFTIGCGQGAIRLHRVQPASRPAMHARDFLNGTNFRTGMNIETGQMA